MKYFLFGALFFLSMFLGACTQVDRTAVPADRSLRDEALHALMAQRIDGLYRRIEVLAHDQNRTLPELDEARQRTTNEIAANADTLSEYAAELTDLAATLDLSTANRQRFLALSGRLQDASDNVVLASAEGSSRSLTEAITGLQETCAACHSLYRDR
ncbi:MAG: hypothetical protein WD396_11545 [Pseudohongiellaceae bacterium]